MSLEDRDYYRAELARKRGVTGTWVQPQHSVLDDILAHHARIDALKARKPSTVWLWSAGCVACCLIGYVAGWALAIL